MEENQQGTMETIETVEMVNVVKIEEWILLILVAVIPVVNLFFLGYFSFKGQYNQSKKNFARAALIYTVTVYALIIITTWIV